MVLAATGPVGTRVCRLLAGQGARVLAGSRRETRAAEICRRIGEGMPDAEVSPVEIDSPQNLKQAMEGIDVVISAGSEGIQLLPASIRDSSADLRVVIDLNAVPPLGVEGIKVHDRGVKYGEAICYGAIGVGGTKMKIHKAAIQSLFKSNSHCLDAETIFQLTADENGAH